MQAFGQASFVLALGACRFKEEKSITAESKATRGCLSLGTLGKAPQARRSDLIRRCLAQPYSTNCAEEPGQSTLQSCALPLWQVCSSHLDSNKAGSPWGSKSRKLGHAPSPHHPPYLQSVFRSLRHAFSLHLETPGLPVPEAGQNLWEGGPLDPAARQATYHLGFQACPMACPMEDGRRARMFQLLDISPKQYDI